MFIVGTDDDVSLMFLEVLIGVVTLEKVAIFDGVPDFNEP